MKSPAGVGGEIEEAGEPVREGEREEDAGGAEEEPSAMEEAGGGEARWWAPAGGRGRPGAASTGGSLGMLGDGGHAAALCFGQSTHAAEIKSPQPPAIP